MGMKMKIRMRMIGCQAWQNCLYDTCPFPLCYQKWLDIPPNSPLLHHCNWWTTTSPLWIRYGVTITEEVANKNPSPPHPLSDIRWVFKSWITASKSCHYLKFTTFIWLLHPPFETIQHYSFEYHWKFITKYAQVPLTAHTTNVNVTTPTNRNHLYFCNCRFLNWWEDLTD